MNLPYSENLPINKLSAVFNNTSATYKYYWLLSIIESIEDGKEIISKRELFARMISNSWYTVNYFKISFGNQDLIQSANKIIKENEGLSIDLNRSSLLEQILESDNKVTNAQLFHFDKNVPHWFLSPWFPKSTKQEIYTLSKNLESGSLYTLDRDVIIVNPNWIPYLFSNSRLIKDFIYWNLSLFLQVRNPNVPDIPSKLIKPALRSSLLNQRKFWDFVIRESGEIKCIYTGEQLRIGTYDVEHFIPYSFVSHNQIWNLIPGDKRFNIQKSNKLPAMDKFFLPFFNLQKLALEVYLDKKPDEKLLQEYLHITPTIEHGLSREKFFDVINPLITIAANNGFEYLN